MMIVINTYSMSRWLVNDDYTRNARLPVMRLVHRNEFVVSTWKYPMLVCMLRLVHGNDIVIYTYEIEPIHVTFYWVSTYK